MDYFQNMIRECIFRRLFYFYKIFFLQKSKIIIITLHLKNGTLYKCEILITLLQNRCQFDFVKHVRL